MLSLATRLVSQPTRRRRKRRDKTLDKGYVLIMAGGMKTLNDFFYTSAKLMLLMVLLNGLPQPSHQDTSKLRC